MPILLPGALLLLQELPDAPQVDPQAMMMVWVIILALVVFTVVCFWKVFEKAGHPGWAAIIPIYNLIVLMRIAGKPGWWVLLLIVPIVSLVISLLASLGVAKRFGRGDGFGLGLWLLPIIFYPILAFGDARYEGGSSPTPAMA